jgi:phosphate transport system protein
MVRLLDLGLERLRSLLKEMADLSEETVSEAIEAYVAGKDMMDEIFKRSVRLRELEDEVVDLAIELIARFQPVASDLRYIRSCMEVAYGFSRFGRYAYDISEVLGMFGDLSKCDHTRIINMGEVVKEMISTSIDAFMSNNLELARTLPEKDDIADKMYEDLIADIVKSSGNEEMRCLVSATLILRYLERIADHANYIGEAVNYVITGKRKPRK